MISVVLPVHNAEAGLERCLHSLVAQDAGAFEVIAVNDGSTDGSRAILDRFAATDPRIQPVHLPHRGIVPALQAGIEAASGSFIARMDADDHSTPDRLRRQADWLHAHPDHGLVSCRVEYGGDRETQRGYAEYVDWTNGLLDDTTIRLNRFIESPLPHPSVMFRRELIDRHGGYREGDFPEDYELWLRWLEADVRMGKVDATLLRWSDEPERLSRRDPRYRPEAFFRTKTAYLARWLQRNNPYHPGVICAGAGRLARRRAEGLLDHGISIRAWIDIDPSKIGREIDGIPVIAYDELPDAGACFVVSWVAKRGARERIVAELESKAYRPGRDFIAAA